MIERYLDPSSYLTGQEAFETFGKLTYQQRQHLPSDDYDDWLIRDGQDREGKKVFYRGKFNAAGKFIGCKTVGGKSQRKAIDADRDLYPEMRANSERAGNGVCTFPGVQHRYATKEGYKPSNTFTAEFDEPSPNQEDWAWIWERLEGLSRLGAKFNILTNSAGKCGGYSPHVTWYLSCTIEDDLRLYLGYLFALLGADQAPSRNLCNQFRIPGFYRHSKGREQGLFKEHHATQINPKALVEAAQALLTELGIEWLLPQSWWKNEQKKHLPVDASFDPKDYDISAFGKLLQWVNSEAPPYLPGTGAELGYFWRLKLASAFSQLLGIDQTRALGQNIFSDCPITWQSVKCASPVGTIVNAIREMVDDESWQLPSECQSSSERFADILKQQYEASNRLTREGSGAAKFEEISSGYFPTDLDVFRPGKGHGLRGGMGTGKTTVSDQAILRQLNGIGLIDLGYRNSLQEQFSARIERISNGERTVKHVSEVYDFQSNPEQIIRLCLDSLLRLPCWLDEAQTIHYFDNKYIRLDEVVSDVKHLLFSATLKENRFEILKRFRLALQRCKGFIYADANLADWVVRFLGELSGKPQELTVNSHKKTTAKLTQLEGTIKEEKIRKNDNSPWLLDIVLRAKRGESFAVASDSQTFIESLEKFLVQYHGITTKIVRIDGKTTERKYIKDFIRHTHQRLEALHGEPIILLFTTSAESGIDIPNRGIFSTVYGFHFGIVDSDSFCQMLGRIRDQNAERKVVIRTQAIDNKNDDDSCLEAEALQHLRISQLSLQSNLLWGETPRLASFAQEAQQTFQLECNLHDALKARRNYEKRNLRECTVQRLINCGYNLESVTVEKTDAMAEVKKQLKEASESVKRQNCHDVANACNDYIGKPYIPLSNDATWEERCAKEKALWFDRLPGFWGDEGNSLTYYSMDADLLYLFKYSQPLLVRGMELYHLSQNLDQAKALAQNRYLRMLEQGGIVPWDVSTQYLKARALSHLPLAELIVALQQGPINADSPIVQTIMEKVKGRFKSDGKRVTLFSALGKKPGRSPVRYIEHLCNLIGVPVQLKRAPDRDPTTESLSLSRKMWGGIEAIRPLLSKAISLRFTRICTGENFSTRRAEFGHTVRGQDETLEPLQGKLLTLTKNEIKIINVGEIFCESTPPASTAERTIENLDVEVEEQKIDEPSSTATGPGEYVLPQPGKALDQMELSVGQRVWLWEPGKQSYVLSRVAAILNTNIRAESVSSHYARWLGVADLEAGWLRYDVMQPELACAG